MIDFGHIKHYFQAKSKKGFGIHSPYIFNLQTLVINPKRRNGKLFYEYRHIHSKTERLILRLLSFFKFTEVLFINCDKLCDKIADSVINKDIGLRKSPENNQKYKAVVVDSSISTISDIKDKIVAEDSIVVVLYIQKGDSAYAFWKELQQLSTVSLDLYTTGICIFKTGMQKEYYKLYF